MAGSVSRRSFVLGLGGAGAAIVAGSAALRSRKDGEAPGPVPEAPVGDERVDRWKSEARGKEVDFYTAVPAGHGDGRGLPVCIVLHGASATVVSLGRRTHRAVGRARRNRRTRAARRAGLLDSDRPTSMASGSGGF